MLKTHYDTGTGQARDFYVPVNTEVSRPTEL
jgi:hypothetical protein